MEVHCLNADMGCEWIGRVEEAAAHDAHCEYRPVRCPNAGCSAKLLQKVCRRDYPAVAQNSRFSGFAGSPG